MADGTSIEWTDATWNPITGCSVVSPGCTNCYAMKLAGTRLKRHSSRAGLTRNTKAGPVWTGAVRFNERWLDQPLRWTKPRMIFVCAHGDLFAESVPDEWIDRVFAVMALASQHTFQVLTKRPERMRRYLSGFDLNNRISEALGRMLDGDWIWREGKQFRGPIEHLIGVFFGEDTDDAGDIVYHHDPMPMANVWLGVSVEDQLRAIERRAPMAELHNRGWLTWVSYEPALGPVDWDGWEFIRWLVSGGESDTDGRSARVSQADWHRHARDFCAANGIAFNFKQWGCLIDIDQIAGRIAASTDAGTAWIQRDGTVWRPQAPLNFADAEWLAGFLGHKHEHHSDGRTYLRIKKGAAGRLLDGVEHNGFLARVLP